MLKDFTSCQKDDKNLPSFLGFFRVLGLYRLFRGVENRMGCVWEQTEHWLPRYARLKVGRSGKAEKQ